MTNLEPNTDTDLVAAFRAGDPDAFARIYDTHVNGVFSGFLAAGSTREDAADATHDTFIEAASQLELQDEPGDLEEWLFDIASDFGVRRDGEEEGEDGETTEMAAAPPALRARVLSKVDRGVTTAPVATSDQDWRKLGLFAAVSLVVGLLGLAVSAGIDPLPPPATTPVAQGPSPTPVGATTTTTETRSTTTASSGGGQVSSTTQPSGGPAAIEVSTDTINFGADATSNEFEVRNSGGQPGQWSLASSNAAIALSAGQGELARGETTRIELSLDREQIAEGDLEETLTLTWSGGEVEIAVVGSHEDNPIIHNPRASPSAVDLSGNPECSNTQTTISARVRDTSPVDSVVVQWNDGSGSRETEMTSVGNDMFDAVIGPFTAVGTTDARVVAFDERGNAGGATIQVSVVACP